MTLTVTHRAPRQIIGGDSIEFFVAIPPDYQSWTGSARITGPQSLDATSCATEGEDFHVFFAGEGSAPNTPNTSQLKTGQYQITVWALDGAGRRKTIAEFPLTIVGDLSTGTPAQKHAFKMLPIIEAEIEARISGNGSGQESFAVEGTAVTKISMETLRALRRQYANEVAAMMNPNGQIPRVKFAMVPTGGIVDMRRRTG